MANTQGFEIVSELTLDVLRQILRAAWKSADDASGTGVIPEKIEIPSSTAFGPYQVKTGTVQIPQEGLDITAVPDENAFEVKMDTLFHVEIENPPIPSATFFDIEAEVRVKTPVANLGPIELGVDFSGLSDDDVSVNITSGDPVGPITDAVVEEFVHQQLRSPSGISTVIDPIPISFAAYDMNVRVEIYDDETDPSKTATVQNVGPDEVEVTIPCYMRFYDIVGGTPPATLESPMGINANIVMTAEYEHAGGVVKAKLSEAEVELTDITPASGDEGTNYTTNKTKISYVGVNLDDLIKTQFANHAAAHLQGMGDMEVTVPSIEQIENFIEEKIRDELVSRDHISIWEPEPPTIEDEEVEINDAAPKVLNEGLAIAINEGSSTNIDALTFFVPDDRDFAIAISDEKVESEMEDAVKDEYGTLPTDLDPVEGHDVTLKKLELSLISNAIKIEGDVTVKDAIAGSIDVDANFEAKAGLRWQDATEGQIIEPFLKGDPDVDLSLLAWILSFLIGFITFGIIGGIIVVVVLSIADDIAEKVGGKVIRDDVTGQLKGIGAWPQTLKGIGTIESRFENPIEISSSGIVFAGTMEIISTRQQALTDLADSHGPYMIDSAMAANFDGGSEKPKTSVNWDFDDGNSASVRKPVHQYAKSGLYIAKLQVEVADMGKVTTRNFAEVYVKNAVPKVTLPHSLTVDEGEEFTLQGSFTDANWVDTHTAVIDWGDNTAPEDLSVQETNSKPQAQGTFCSCHAYCDNGSYFVKVRVFDDVGGVGEAEMPVEVHNVPPVVELPEKRVTLLDQPIRLNGNFYDEGWCDTHQGVWDTGDCYKADAIIRETNKKPRAEGTAENVHYYRNCGRYIAELTVTDDDGGSDRQRMEIQAYKLNNPEYGEGFYLFPSGDVKHEIANDWHPVVSESFGLRNISRASVSVETQRQVNFFAEENVDYRKQWAQGVRLKGQFLAGIYQQIPANSGWGYEFFGYFHQDKPATGAIWIGIDPLGGVKIESDSVTWRKTGGAATWKEGRVRTEAKHETITLYLAILGTNETESTAYFDKAKVYQIQPYGKEKGCEDRKVDFESFNEGSEMQKDFTYEELTFKPLGDKLFITTLGAPEAQKKLGFKPEGLEVIFPNYVDEIELKVNNYYGRSLSLSLLRDEDVVDERTLAIVNEVKTFTIEFENFNGFRLSGGGGEASLIYIQLCI